MGSRAKILPKMCWKMLTRNASVPKPFQAYEPTHPEKPSQALLQHNYTGMVEEKSPNDVFTPLASPSQICGSKVVPGDDTYRRDANAFSRLVI